MIVQKLPFNAQERDIDLMLLEEIHCDAAFLDWITNRAKITGAHLYFAQHSVYQGNGEGKGETDLLVLLNTSNGRTALMIEDKIGAQMQPKQAARYRKRGEQMIAEGSIVRYATLLCAPKNYLNSIPPGDWDVALSFEDIADWFQKQNGRRAEWRRDALIRAAKRQERSLAVVTDEALLKFKTGYRNYVRTAHPEFVFTEQFGRDKEYYFTEVNFPKRMRLKHNFTNSTMVLVCEHPWKEVASAVLPSKIPENMSIEQHPSAVHLITGVEPIDLDGPVEDQTDLIDKAIQAARQLLPYATMIQ